MLCNLPISHIVRLDVYKRQEDSRETTLENILAAMPYMDEDMRQLAAAAVNKLQAITDSEFSEREFILSLIHI